MLYLSEYVLQPKDFRKPVVSLCQTFLHSAAEEGLASPQSIPGWEKNVLWFIGISLNQSQSSWAAPESMMVPLQNSLGKELVLVEHVYVQKLF